MNRIAKLTLGAMLMMGAATAVSAPASAGISVGVSFGWGGPGYVSFADPCAYYDYYDVPPPWGLPPDYCDYPVYFGEVYWGNSWYRGPIYYRWANGHRHYWINGGWRRDGWHGGPRPQVRWNDRGGWGHGVGPRPHDGSGHHVRGPGGGPGHDGSYRGRGPSFGDGPRGGGPSYTGGSRGGSHSGGGSGFGGGSRGGSPGGGGHGGGHGGGGHGGGGHGGGGHRGGH